MATRYSYKEPPARAESQAKPPPVPILSLQKALLLSLLWLILALMTTIVAGAFVSKAKVFDAPWQIFALLFSIHIGLPLLFATQSHNRPFGWGIGFNLVVLAAFIFAVPSTPTMFESHGNWAQKWTSTQPGYALSYVFIETSTDLTRLIIRKLHTATVGVSEKSESKAGGHEKAHPSVRSETGASSKPGTFGSSKNIYGFDDPERLDVDLSDDGSWKQRVKAQLAKPLSPTSMAELEQKLMAQLNYERTKIGLKELQPRPEIMVLARAHSEDMRDRRYFDHADPEGLGPTQRLGRAGLKGMKVEEVIGSVTGYGDKAKDLMKTFMARDADKNLILNVGAERDYQGMGTGIACENETCFATLLLVM